MISEYIDSFDEFYKLDLSFSEFYSQHYGDYRHMDCEVGNPFEIFDGNGHKIREKRIERIEREIKSVYLIATRDLRISGCNFFYLKIKGLCDFLRKRF